MASLNVIKTVSAQESNASSQPLPPPVILAIAGGTLVIILLFLALCVTSCATLCLVFRHRYRLFLARQQQQRLQQHRQQEEEEEEGKDAETADVYVQRHLQIRRCSKTPRNASNLSFSFSDRISVYKHNAPLAAANAKVRHACAENDIEEDYDYVIASSANRRVSTSKSDNSKRSNRHCNDAMLKQALNSVKSIPCGFNIHQTTNNSRCFIISSNVPEDQRFVVSPSFLSQGVTSRSATAKQRSSTAAEVLLSVSDNQSSSASQSTRNVNKKLTMEEQQKLNKSMADTNANGRENPGFLLDKNNDVDDDDNKSRDINDDFYWMPTMSELSVRVRSCPDSPRRLLARQGHGRQRPPNASGRIIRQPRSAADTRSETVLEVEPLKVLRTFRPLPSPHHDRDTDGDTISHASYCYIDTSRDSDTGHLQLE